MHLWFNAGAGNAFTQQLHNVMRIMPERRFI